MKERCRCDPAYHEIRPNICKGENITCFKKVTAQLGKWRTVKDTVTNSTRRCMAACEDIYYSVGRLQIDAWGPISRMRNCSNSSNG